MCPTCHSRHCKPGTAKHQIFSRRALAARLARDRTCRSPVCRQPAARCDQDHTNPYHRGGRTSSCNLGGVCRTHHKLKQLPGWHLSQDAHGTFTWQTPAGLTYRNEPHRYPI